MRSDLRGNRVEIGPLAGLEFGVDEFTVDANFEGTAAGRDQPGSHARGLTNASRQTGGFRFVISDRAVFDRYFRFHACLLYLLYAMRPRLRCRALTPLPSNEGIPVRPSVATENPADASWQPIKRVRRFLA
jgi:hypothetical protein